MGRLALAGAALFGFAAMAGAAAPSACSILASLPEMRQAGPAFLTSFPTAAPGPLKDVSFLYDDAVSAIALVACDQPAKAAQIGDAILLALDHDRYWKDGHLRNGYLAGPVKEFPVKLPGWWDAAQNKWVEDGYQVGSDTGNMAWAMLALLTVAEARQAPQYRQGAERIARAVEHSFSPTRPAGFDGGTFGEETAPVRNTWKSTEHNTDLAAAFARLANDSGDGHWTLRAQQAQRFVRAMWRHGRFDVGTAADGRTHNRLLALDAQVWPLLAIPGFEKRGAAVFATLDRGLRQGDGYAYSEARQGVWTEGTAQVALLMAYSGRVQDSQRLLAALEVTRGADGWYDAANTAALPTGFMLQTDPSQPRVYFRIPHVAALAWVALAEQNFNPFTGNSALPKGAP